MAHTSNQGQFRLHEPHLELLSTSEPSSLCCIDGQLACAASKLQSGFSPCASALVRHFWVLAPANAPLGKGCCRICKSAVMHTAFQVRQHVSIRRLAAWRLQRRACLLDNPYGTRPLQFCDAWSLRSGNVNKPRRRSTQSTLRACSLFIGKIT